MNAEGVEQLKALSREEQEQRFSDLRNSMP